MRLLIINDEIRRQIASLVKFAENNEFSVDDVLDVTNGELPCAGDMAGFKMTISDGYHVVFSIENHGSYKVRHISISVDTPNKMPNQTAIEMIIKEFGFIKPLLECKLGIEKISGTLSAINVIEKIV